MTIKTQGGKVITKGGKVSCECCGEEEGICSFYPAVGIEQGFYSEDDLPNEIFARYENEQYLFTKDGDSFYATIDGIDFRIIPKNNGDPIWEPGQEDFNIRWQLEYFSGGNWLDDGVEDKFDNFLFTPIQLTTRDLFASTYTISGTISGSVVRVPADFIGGPEKCEWIGDGLKLRYNGRFTYDPLYLFEGNFKWQINGNNKSGFQNTPVGDYAGGFTFS
jgi:hypothetical protein